MNQTATAQKKTPHLVRMFTALIHAIQQFFTRFKQKRIEAEYYKKMKKAHGTQAARLALSSCSWVNLYWNGVKRPFLIHQLNFQELLMCGRFPNVLFQFVKGLAGTFDADDEGLPQIDAQKMQEEEEEFRHELAEKSMIYPRYRECYEAITAILGNPEARREDVMPRDFINDLFLWYVQGLQADIKKKSEQLALSASDGLPNTGSVPQAATFQD